MRVRKNVMIDEELFKESKKMCIDKGITFSDLINRLLKNELEKEDKVISK